MLRGCFAAIASGAVLTVGLMNPAAAADKDFVGNWVNTNHNTRDITRVQITNSSPNQLNIRIFGKCEPSDCDWGTVSLTTYGQNVEDANHFAGTAVYSQGFKNTIVVLRLSNSSLSVQTYSKFTDNSNRQNYVSSDVFQRLLIPRPPIPRPIPRPL